MLKKLFAVVLSAFIASSVASAIAAPVGSPAGPNYRETKAQKMRRLMERARVSNPIINAPLSGAWPWAASTTYASGQVGAKVSNGGNVYILTGAGTTASTGGPTGYGPSITDGTATWAYYGVQTAPVVTNTAAQLAGLTQHVTNTDARFRYGGGNTVANSGGFAIWSVQQGSTDVNCRAAAATPYNQNGTGGFVEFTTDAPQISLDFKQSNFFVTVIVTELGAGPGDARFVDPAPFQLTSSGSGHSYLNLDFTHAATATTKHWRKVRVDFGCGQVFFGVYVAPTDALGAPSRSDVIHVAVLGDSWTQCNGIVAPQTLNASYGAVGYGWRANACWAEVLGWMLGWDDVWASGASGTGYFHTTTTYSQPFYGRVADIGSVTDNGVTFTPDVILIMGGQNDPSTDLPDLATGVTQTLRNIRNQLPNVPIIVVGFNSYNADTLALTQPEETAIQAQVAAFNDPKTYFVPNITSPDTGPPGNPQGFITGSGNVGSHQGNGNADFYVGMYLSPSDNHPNDQGGQFLGVRLADEIRPVIETASW